MMIMKFPLACFIPCMYAVPKMMAREQRDQGRGREGGKKGKKEQVEDKKWLYMSECEGGRERGREGGGGRGAEEVGRG